MNSPQGGIFALGTAAHTYLELDAVAGPVRPTWSRASPRCASREPRSAA